jgi:hypothetical protein
MKKVVLAIALTLTGFINAQSDTNYFESDSAAMVYAMERLDSLLEDVAQAEALKPTYKEGDDDSGLRGLLQYIFSDPDLTAPYLYMSYNVSGLYVTGNSGATEKMSFDRWLLIYLEPNDYPEDLYSFEYYNYDHTEQFAIINKSNGKAVRIISIVWDQTFDGTAYSNIRYFSDTSLDHNDIWKKFDYE